MLDRAVAAVKEDKAKALDMFNKGEGGFKDRDLYVSCANASDGVVNGASLPLKGATSAKTSKATRAIRRSRDDAERHRRDE